MIDKIVARTLIEGIDMKKQFRPFAQKCTSCKECFRREGDPAPLGQFVCPSCATGAERKPKDVGYSTMMGRQSKSCVFSRLFHSKGAKNVFMNKRHDIMCRMVGGKASAKLLASDDWVHMGAYDNTIVRADLYDDIEALKNEHPLAECHK
ncbi:MAG: hypothetical protein DRQ56_06715 [Gammaproteobacteria bacterium]|nr:MAG: hypothetical protein DRQ56_06715 [Gammaproteobacteria bacterium]